MEQRRGADACRMALEIGAVLKLDVFEFLDAGEMPVDQTGVGQGMAVVLIAESIDSAPGVQMQ